ncbi:MAG: hypothetical protein EPN85_02950 [Bacteroidetes bacterium]|nr:MAG: hypothetical protein EPN85_02950 [Bacteroidota bacterium]
MSKIYRLKYLKKNRLLTFFSVADRVIPADTNSPGGGSMETAAVVDWYMKRVPENIRKKILLFLDVIQFTGLFFGGNFFSSNNIQAQERQLKWMENNKIRLFRMGFFGIKTFIEMGYYTREDIWSAISYDGPVLPGRTYSDSTIRELCQNTLKISE